MSGASVLRSEALAVGYRAPVLSDIDLDFSPGQFIALLGPNGAGKTTLLRTLSRHLKPLGGTIELLGNDLHAMRAMDLARVVAVCLTDNAKPPLLSVEEFVALGRHPHTGFMGRLGPRDRDVIERALTAVVAGDLSGRLVEQLSDGERQKVVLARALGANIFLRPASGREDPDQALAGALDAMAGCDLVVDSGMVGSDAETIRARSIALGLLFFYLGDDWRPVSVAGENACLCGNLGELSEAIDRLPLFARE